MDFGTHRLKPNPGPWILLFRLFWTFFLIPLPSLLSLFRFLDVVGCSCGQAKCPSVVHLLSINLSKAHEFILKNSIPNPLSLCVKFSEDLILVVVIISHCCCWKEVTESLIFVRTLSLLFFVATFLDGYQTGFCLRKANMPTDLFAISNRPVQYIASLVLVSSL